ncbi:MAG: hypothetical protein K8I30_20585 [Anaerolineae bacterium]|nr:hypothetical protein [Anaerolineae bacterium]
MMRRCWLVLMIGLLAVTGAAAQETTEEAPEATIEAAATAEPTPVSAPVSDALSVLISARTDLELLANNQMGSQRPTGWSGSLDINSPDMLLLLRLDLELLVGTLYGLDTRPPGWFGPTPGTAYNIARDIRHDLEVLADTLIAVNVRPPGWTGDLPLMRCDRATQALIDLLSGTGFTITANPLSPDYCQQAATQASQFSAGGGTASLVANQVAPVEGAIHANGAATLAFLDRHARKRVGLIPETVTFVPLARSYAQFSHMTLVRGSNFVVFVDYTTTTLSEEAFDALPNINDTEQQSICDADWCVDPY